VRQLRVARVCWLHTAASQNRRKRGGELHFTGHELNHLLSVYGYWGVMLFVALEAIGIPIPGETMLIAASIYAGTTHDLDITLVIGAASCGDNIGFWPRHDPP
jgi:membrane protein DedA with SNARE-associated domain